MYTMKNAVSHLKGIRMGRRGVTAVCALAGLMGLMAGSPAFAQDKKAAAPAATDKKADDKRNSAWVKLCEKTKLNHINKEGKEVTDEKNICLTHHERLDGNSGRVMVSAAIREVEGQEKKSLMVMVPLGMALPPGLQAAVYSKEQWEKAAKNEKVGEEELKPIKLRYSLCGMSGCTAEVEATPEMIKQLKEGEGLMIITLNAGAQPVGFPVPLTGFTAAYDGKPVDNEEYAKARGQLMEQIRQRQAQLREKAKAEQMKALPELPGGGAGGSVAAPAAKGSDGAAKKK